MVVMDEKQRQENAILEKEMRLFRKGYIKENWVENIAGNMHENQNMFEWIFKDAGDIVAEHYGINGSNIINLTRFVLLRSLPIALINVEGGEEHIEKVYSEREEVYKEAYLDSPLSSKMTLRFVPYSKRYLFEKAAGIVAQANITGDNITVMKLIRLMLPRMYNKLTKTNHVGPTEEVILLDNLKSKKTSEKELLFMSFSLGEYDFYARKFLSTYIMMQPNSRSNMFRYGIHDALLFLSSESTASMNIDADNQSFYEVNFNRDISELPLRDRSLEERLEYFKNDKVLSSYFEELKSMILPSKIKDNHEEFVLADRLFSTFTDLAIETEVYNSGFDGELLNIFFQEDEQYRNILQQQVSEKRKRVYRDGGLSSMIGWYSTLTKTLGLPEKSQTTLFTVDDLITLVDIFDFGKRVNRIEGTLSDHIIPLMLMLNLIKEMRHIEDYSEKIAEQTIQEKYKSFIKEIEELKEEKDQVEKEFEEFSNKVKDLPKDWKVQFEKLNRDKKDRDKIIDNKNAEIQKLKDALRESQDELKKTKSERLDMIQYQEFLEDVATQAKGSVNESDEEAMKERLVEFLKENNITIVGGNTNWVSKLQSEFADSYRMKFIDVDRSSDVFKEKNPTHYFVVANYCNHRLYKELRSNINKKSKIHYLNDVTNVNLTIKEILQNIES